MFIVTATITINRLYTVGKQRHRWKRNLAFAKWGFYFAGFSRTNFVRAFKLSHFNLCFFFNKVIFLIFKAGGAGGGGGGAAGGGGGGAGGGGKLFIIIL